MELRFARLIALICLCAISVTDAAVARNNYRCHTSTDKCLKAPEFLRYESGKTYSYNYDITTRLKLKCENGDGPTVQISGQAIVHVQDHCDFTLQLRETTVRGPVNRESYKTSLEAHDLPFGYVDGKVENVCPVAQEEQWALNVKKAIISALQLSTNRPLNEMSGKRTVHESDLLGEECETAYEYMPSPRRITVTRVKDLKTCANGAQTLTALFPRSYASQLGAIRSLPLAQATHECKSHLEPSESIIKQVQCTQTTSFVPLTYSIHEASIESTLKLSLAKVTVISAPRPSANLGNRRQSLTLNINDKADRLKNIDYLSLETLVKSLCQSINGAIDSRATSAFSQLVEGLRAAGAVDVNRLHGAILLKELCQSQKMMDLFLDAAQMSGSEAALKLMTELTISERISKTRATYFMFSLPFVSRPSKASIEAVLPLLEQDQVPRAALLGVSGLIRNYCTRDAECGRNSAVQSAIELITRDLGEDAQDEVIAALKALENIGHFDSVPPTVTKLVDELATDKSKPDVIRVGAISALGQVVTKSEAVRRKIMKVFRSDDSVEVRIAAYQSVIKFATEKEIDEVLEQLRRETVKQVGSYVVSHLANLKESSDPEKEAIAARLADKSLPLDRFPSDIRRYSRNVELSLHQASMLNLGGVLEADTVFDKSYVPKSLSAGVKIPAFGRTIELAGVTIRQQGLEHQLEKIFGPRGYLAKNKGSFPEILRDLIQIFNDEAAQAEARKSLSKRSTPALAFLDRARAVNDVAGYGQTDAQLFIQLDGKTVFYLDLNDAQKPQINYDEFIEKLKETIEYDHGYGLQLVDTQVQIPAVNGIPVRLDLNGNLLVGLKATLQATLSDLNGLIDGSIIPSFAFEHVASVSFDAKEVTPGLRWTTKLSSSPVISAKGQLTDGRIGTLSIRVPQDQIELLKFSSEVSLVEANGNVRLTKADKSRKVISCTSDRAAKVFGLALCAEGQLPTEWFRLREPFTLLNNQMFGQIVIKKADTALTSYDFTVELPSKNSAAETWTYKASFSTPGSRVDREIAAEAEVINQRLGQKGVKVALKTPIKTLNAGAFYRNDRNEVSFKAEAALDSDRYLFDIGLERSFKGRKSEYKPRLTLEAAGYRPTALRGTLSVVKGRKNQLQFDLHSQQGGKSFVRGNVLQEQIKPGEVKVSTDLNLNLGDLLEGRFWGSCEQNRKAMIASLNMDYTAGRSARKQSVKVVGKINNLSTPALTKYGTFVEMTNTQWPQLNWNAQYNLIHKESEHLENELKLRWSGNLRDASRSLALLQVSKILKSRNGRTFDNKLVLGVPMLSLNWDGVYRSTIEDYPGQGPSFKWEFKSIDKARNQDQLDALFGYRQESSEPLKLNIEAEVKYPGRHIVYKDRIEEQNPREYVGHTEFQWQTNRRATADYTYIYSSTPDQLHADMQLDVKVPWQREPFALKQVVTWKVDEAKLKSVMKNDGVLIYELGGEYTSNDGKVSLVIPQWDVQELTLAGKRDSRKTVAMVEYVGKDSGKTHKTEVSYDSNGLVANSQTKTNGKSVLTVDTVLSKSRPSHFDVTAEPIKGRVEVNPQSRAGKIVFKTPTIGHKSELKLDSENSVLKSETDVNGRKWAHLQGTVSQSIPTFARYDDGRRVAVFELDKDTGMTKVSFSCPSKEVQGQIEFSPEYKLTMSANDKRSRSKIIDLNASLNKPQRRGLFARSGDNALTGKLDIVMPQYGKHQTELKYDDDILVNSKTYDNLDRPVALIKLLRSVESPSIIEYEDSIRRGKIAFSMPKRTATWTWKCPRYEHDGEVNLNSRPYKLAMVSRSLASKLFEIQASCDPTDRSLVTVEIRDAQVKVDVSSYLKQGVVSFKCPKYDHSSEWSISGRDVTLKSRTSPASNLRTTLMKLDAFVSPVKKSSIDLSAGPRYKINAVYQPFGPQNKKTGRINAQYDELSHQTDFEYEPSSPAFFLRSLTESGRALLAKVDATLAFNDQSSLVIETAPWSGEVFVNPSTMNGRVAYKSKSLTHTTEIKRDTPIIWILESTTTAGGRKVAVIKSSLALDMNEKSSLNVEIPSAITFVEVRPGQPRYGKLTFSSNRYAHETELSEDRDGFKFLSVSKHKNGRNLADINGVLSRSSPSTLRVTLPEHSANIHADLLSRSKNIKADLKWPENTHETSVTIEPSQLKYLTRHTRSGRFHSIDLTASPASLSFNGLTPDHQLTVTGSKNSRLNKAKVEYVGKTSGNSHLTEIQHDSNGLKINSQALANGQAYVIFDSMLSQSQPSHLDLTTDPVKGRLEVNPKTRAGKLAFNTQSVDHKSEITFDDDNTIVKSATDVDGQKWAHINGIVSDTLPILVRYDDGRRVAKFEYDKTTGLTKVQWTCPGKDITGMLELDPEYKLTISATDKRARAKIIDLIASLSKPQPTSMFSSASNALVGKLDINMPEYGKHNTELKYGDDSVLMNSKTLDKNGRLIANVKALQSVDSPSVLEYDDGNRRGKLAISIPKRTATWTWKCPRYEHDGEVALDSRPYKLAMVSRSRNVKLFEIQASCDPTDKSLVTIEVREAKVKVDVASGLKQGLVTFQCPKYDHITEWTINSREISVKSRTSPANNIAATLMKLDSRLTQTAPSTIDLSFGKNYKLNALYDGTDKTKSAKIAAQYESVKHASEVEYSQNLLPITLKSITESNRSPVAQLNIVLNPETKSRLAIDIAPFSSELSFDPATTDGRLALKSDSYDHLTELRRQSPSIWTIESTNKANGRNVAHIKSKLSLDTNELSTFSLKTPSVASTFEMRPAQPRRAKLTYKSGEHDHETEYSEMSNGFKVKSTSLKGSARYPAYRQESLLEFQTPLRLVITSKHDKNGQNLADINALLSQSGPSNLRVVIPEYNADINADLLSASKKIKAELNWPDNTHETTINMEPASIKYLTRHTRNGQLRSIELTASRNSVSLNGLTPDHQVTVVGHKNSRLTSAKVEYVGKASGKTHLTEVSYDSNGIKANSQTQNGGSPVLLLDTILSQSQPSHFDIASEPLKGRLEVNLINPESRVGKLAFKTGGIVHKSEINYDNENAIVKSETDVNGRKYAHLTGIVSSTLPTLIKYDDGRRVGKFELDKTTGLTQVSWSCPSKEVTGKLEFSPEYKFLLSATDKRSRAKIIDLNASLSKPQRQEYGLFRRSAGDSITGKLDVIVPKYGKHHTEFKYDDDMTVLLTSKTMDNGNRPVALIKVLRSANSPSMIEYEDSVRRGKIALNLATRHATWTWKCPRYEHDGEISMASRPYKLAMVSRSLTRGVKLYEIKASCDPTDKYLITVELPQASGKFDASSNLRQGAVTFKCPKYEHASEWSIGRDSSLKSRTSSKSKNLMNLDARVARSGRSALDFGVGQRYKLNAIYEPAGRIQSGKVEAQYDGLTHQSTLEYDQMRPSITLNSLTESSRSLVAKVDAVLTTEGQSRLDVETPAWSGEAFFNPSTKNGRVELKSRSLSHLTEFRREGLNSWGIESTTNAAGRQLAAIKSHLDLDMNELSTVNVVMPTMVTNLEVRPATPRHAKLTYKSDRYDHETEYNEITDGVKVKSSTMKDNDQLLKLDTLLSQHRPSHIVAMSGSSLSLNANLNPTDKTGKVSIKTPNYEHESSAAIDASDNSVQFKSKTKSPMITLAHDVIDNMEFEFENPLANRASYIARDAVRSYLAHVPSEAAGSRKFIAIDPDKGELDLEIRASLEQTGSRINDLYREHAAKVLAFRQKLTAAKSMLSGEWLPPFRSKAMLIGGQHFITFDKHFYDFAGTDCTYLLARDHIDGNFTVLAKYHPNDRSGQIRKSIIVHVDDANVIELDNNAKSVKLNGQLVELPLYLGKASVFRKIDSIVIDDSHGLTVECQLTRDICTVSMSGFYFGKTNGLFGRYDYESENDMHRPMGRSSARHAYELAKAYEMDTGCRSQNVARDEEVKPGTEGYQLCHGYFIDTQSPLADGFGLLPPESYFRMCLRHVAAARRNDMRSDTAKQAACTAASAYIHQLSTYTSDIQMPAECLACEEHGIAYGSQSQKIANQKEADVIFVIEEQECAKPIVDQIDSMARLIEREMQTAGFKSTKFGVVAFGGPEVGDYQGEPHAHTARGELLFGAHDVVLATEKMSYKASPRSGRRPSSLAFDALAFAAEYPLRAGANKQIVLITCSQCSASGSILDYSDIQRLLLDEGITVHILADKPISVRGGSDTKSRSIYGVDSDTVFRGKDLSQKPLIGAPDLRSQIAVPKDLCVALAQESHGSFFSTLPFVQSPKEAKQWKSLVARRLSSQEATANCVVCDCMSTRDGLSSRASCRPCESRQAKLPPYLYTLDTDDYDTLF